MRAPDTALHRFEQQLGRVLVGGVVLSAICLTCGVVLWFRAPASLLTDRFLRAGLLALMATPMLRVVVSVAEFIRMRDWFFVLTTVLVLMVLMSTLLFAVLAE